MSVSNSSAGKLGDAERGPRCLVCGSNLGVSTRFQGLLACASCGFTTAGLHLDAADFEQLYGRHYFNGGEYLDYLDDAPSHMRNFRRRIETLHSVVPNIGEKRLLEIGCAYGLFLQQAKEFFASVQGVDIARDAVHHAQSVLGLHVRHGDYLGLDLKDAFDVATLWDTIEHLERPDLYLEKISNEIRSGGYLALTTGDIGSLNARVRGSRWRMIHPPTHLHYFSASSIRTMLQRHGFETVHMSHPPNFRVARSMLYIILVLRLRWTSIYRHIQAWPIWDVAVPLNLFDIMFVIAKKR